MFRKSFLYLVILASLSTSDLHAQELSLETAITEAILDLTTTPRRHLAWRPCGESFRGRDPEAKAYARNIANHVITAAGDDLDPWVMVAVLKQESNFNPCVFSNREFNLYARSLGRRPNEQDILRLLTSPRTREEHGIRGMDAGIAQFRWPGIARGLGVTRPEELLDVERSITVFATALRRYRGQCREVPTLRVQNQVTRRGRIVVQNHEFRCTDVYWAIHNSGSVRSIRYVYINNVLRHLRAVQTWKDRVHEEARDSAAPADLG